MEMVIKELQHPRLFIYIWRWPWVSLFQSNCRILLSIYLERIIKILLHFGLCFRTTGSSKIQKPFFNFVNSTINKELRKVLVGMKHKYENDVLIGEVYWPSIDYCYFIFI